MAFFIEIGEGKNHKVCVWERERKKERKRERERERESVCEREADTMVYDLAKYLLTSKFTEPRIYRIRRINFKKGISNKFKKSH